MVFRTLAAAAPGLLALTFLTSASLAQDAEPARAMALEKLKGQLIARSELVAGLDLTGGAKPTDSRDAVARRLDSVFDLVTPDTTSAESPRLPLPRPERPGEADALAYAAPPTRARGAGRAGGLSAIEDLVQQHAEANDVPPALAQALVQVESSHNPKATGRNGEIGLLQIKPTTARAMGYKGSAKGLYDPETNLAYGMKYLGKAHDLSGGDVCGTLLRYNAGLDAKRKSAASNKFCRKVKSVMAKRA